MTDTMLPLDQPRSIALKVNGTLLIYNLRRITADDWSKYFAGIVNETIETKAGRERMFEADSALIELVTNTVQSVAGYAAIPAEWKPALPARPRLAVGRVLRAAAIDRQEDGMSLSPLQDVRLSCSWTLGDDGKMLSYSGLVHRFRHPSIGDLKAFNMETARVKVSGSAEYGRTVYPERQAIAMRLYDQLIEEVDGYSVNGAPLTSKEEIVREMDGAHKAAAMLEALVGSGEEELAIVGADAE